MNTGNTKFGRRKRHTQSADKMLVQRMQKRTRKPYTRATELTDVTVI
jgi:hypothetical protein